MPSFSKMSVFPVGYFRATTQWLLRERRDVVARIATITAEMNRIGIVEMHYATVDAEGGTKATERRTGFTVTEGSSIAKLLQAYIATGGNPFNISGFLHPDTTKVVVQEDGTAVRHQKHPGGGAPAARSVEYNNPHREDGDPDNKFPEKTGYEGYEGGYVDSSRYLPGRMGGRMDRGGWDSATVLRVMHDVRKWANKEIKARLQDAEWRIIKLSDLHEQLKTERDMVLMEAFGGQLNDMPSIDDEKFDPQRLCQVLIQQMYSLMFATGASGIPTTTKASPTLGLLYFVFEDKPEDSPGPMG